MPAKLVAPRTVKRVWILTFELAPLVKLGGLGEAVRQYAVLLDRAGIDVTVFMPSHGRHLDLGLRSEFKMRPLDFAACGERRGLDGNSYGFCVGAEEAYVDGIRTILFKGLDYRTGNVFDTWNPYSYVEEKAAIFARAMKAYSWNEVPPDLIHVNDWHTVLAGIALRDEFEKRGLAIPVDFTIHLSGSPSFPWHYASEDWSGLEDSPHLVWRVAKHVPLGNRYVWDSVGGNVEAFGVHEADVVQTVSHSYLNEEIKARYGNWIEGKSCVVYNSTDWSREAVDSWIRANYGDVGRDALVKIVERYIRPSSWTGMFNDLNRSFMVLPARLTSQKGIDVAIRALDYAPSVNLIVLGIPVGDYGYEEYVRRLAEERRGRVMISSARMPLDAYQALIRLADALVVPSRWEPFGLVAIEAMSLGTPVIASAVGGLKEIVVDIRGGRGSGLLVRPNDEAELGLAMESMAHVMWDKDPSKIPIKEIKEIATSEPDLPETIRKTAMDIVESRFRPESTLKQLLACYEKARQMAFYRAITK